AGDVPGVARRHLAAHPDPWRARDVRVRDDGCPARALLRPGRARLDRGLRDAHDDRLPPRRGPQLPLTREPSRAVGTVAVGTMERVRQSELPLRRHSADRAGSGLGPSGYAKRRRRSEFATTRTELNAMAAP